MLYPQEFVLQIIDVQVEETLLLDEVAEHQTVQHYAGVPLLIAVLLQVCNLIVDAADVFGKVGVLFAETCIEILCNLLRVDDKSFVDAVFHINDGGTLVQIEADALYLVIQEVGLRGRRIFHQYQITLLNLLYWNNPQVMLCIRM